MIDEKLGVDGIKHLIFSPAEPGKYLLGTMNDTATNIIEYYVRTRIPITHLSELPVVIKSPVGRQKWELLHDNIQVDKKIGSGENFVFTFKHGINVFSCFRCIW
uniref:Uncharacterized protein n=1 Tax=Panagrolaimus superbus TaxID=310955 RepID=A0A914YVW2_9BILA